MKKKTTTEEDFVTFKAADVLSASQSLIAVSSIVEAVVEQYAHTGVLSVGALVHAGNVVDEVIGRLGLAELDVDEGLLPF